MSEATAPTLRRSLGPVALTLYGLGNILGAGIYVLVGETVGIAGYLTPLAFIAAAFVAGLAAFSFGELSARFPVSAGEAAYVEAAFDTPRLALVVGLAVALAGLVSAATLSRGVIGYVQLFVDLPDAMIVIAVVLMFGTIAAWGINASVRIAAALTVVEAGGLFLVIGVAFNSDVTALPIPMDAYLPEDVGGFEVIAAGAFLAFFAFIGFEDMVNVAEEVRAPERTLPLAIIAALAIATLIYLAVIVAALRVVEPQVLADSKAPLAVVFETATGRSPFVLSAIGTLAAVNGMLVQLIMASRMLYGLASRGHLPAVFARVSPRTRTPVIATVTITGAVMVLALAVPLGTLARATSFIILAVFATLAVALLVLHRTRAAPEGVRTVPTWIPAAGLAGAIALLVAEAVAAL